MSNTNYVHIHSECAKCGGCIYECEHKVKTVLTTTSSKEEYVIMTDRPTPASDEIDQHAQVAHIMNLYAIHTKYDDLKSSKLASQEIENMKQLIAAAVQAESRKLLSDLRDWIDRNHLQPINESDRWCQASREIMEHIDVLLDSEQQKLGGK